MKNSFAFCREKNGQCTEDSYGYTSTEGTFKASSRNVEFAPGSVTGYRDVSTDNEQTLMSTVALQQVSVAIEADQSSFQSYRSVVRCPCLTYHFGGRVLESDPSCKGSWIRGGVSGIHSIMHMFFRLDTVALQHNSFVSCHRTVALEHSSNASALAQACREKHSAFAHVHNRKEIFLTI